MIGMMVRECPTRRPHTLAQFTDPQVEVGSSRVRCPDATDARSSEFRYGIPKFQRRVAQRWLRDAVETAQKVVSTIAPRPDRSDAHVHF